MDRPRPVDRDVECIRWLAHDLSGPTDSNNNRTSKKARKIMSQFYGWENASDTNEILADHLDDGTSAMRKLQR